MNKILVINGPNLNRLGVREPAVYGTDNLQNLEEKLQRAGRDHGVEVECVQSNHEGVIIDWIHEADEKFDGIMINPGAFTHYSYAIRDAIASISVPVIEVHISNVHAREEFRKLSHVSGKSTGSIFGLGLKGYELALEWFVATASK